MRVCKCVQNRIGEAEAWPSWRTWDIETTGILAEVPNSFNEPEHLSPYFVPPSQLSVPPPSVLDRSSLPKALGLFG